MHDRPLGDAAGFGQRGVFGIYKRLRIIPLVKIPTYFHTSFVALSQNSIGKFLYPEMAHTV
jgi:hypothetical protein